MSTPISYADFDIYKSLGDGFTSTVVLARNKRNGNLVALKEVRTNTLSRIDESGQHFVEEAQNLSKLSDLNSVTSPICRLYDIIKDRRSTTLILEYAPGIPLHSLYSRTTLSLLAISFIIHNVVKALSLVHNKRIIHRDVKANNIIISQSGQMKLIDFGLSLSVPFNYQGPLPTPCGAMHIRSPEEISLSEKKNEYDLRLLDGWALGVLAYELFARCLIFEGEVTKEVMEGALDEESGTLWKTIREKLEERKDCDALKHAYLDFVMKALSLNYNDRLFATEEVREHPFVQAHLEYDIADDECIQDVFSKIPSEIDK